jgi:hypothetical protein
MQQIDGRLAAIEQEMAAAVFSGPITEPTLGDLFSDPMTHALMTADRVEYSNLEALLRAKRAQLALSGR